ncbi:cation:proton antiporter domain-containing protein [Flavisphingomonas formosensis]|uniref:cation:proton antiporter domain-containing protein n=1 Tax=Flavisphingomonas formosensis TaxID=861534 RepID=UPI0012F7B68D|nr:cation:proton antiporter [Sphingomonas formosensis]
MSAAGAGLTLLYEGVIPLGAALGSALIFRRLGLGAVLAYIVAGAVIGPQVLGLTGDAESKLGIADFGIVLLLFLVGLELHPSRLWRLRRDIFGLGTAQVVLCGAALATMIYFGTPFTLAASIALGLPLALSSTAQVLPMLRSAGRLHTPFGERSFSILLFQDLSIVPLITIVAALSRAPADPTVPPGWLLAIYTVVAIAGLVAAGRYVLNPLFRLIGRLGEREMFVAAGLFTVLASAAVMQMLHLSPALGAFIAGVMLADSPYRHELEADVEPFRTILLGMFFLAVGMMLDLHAIAARPAFVIGLALSVVAVKALIISGLALIARMSWRQALGLGLLLSQGGEFGFVLFAQAERAMLISTEAASLLGAVVTLSMATTPFLMNLSRRLRQEPPEERDDLDEPQAGEGGSAIVVGYGRFGQTVVQMLLARDLPVTIIDSEPEQIDVSGRFGVKVYYGDGLRLDLLRQAGADEARAILFCVDGDRVDADLLRPIAEAFPQAALFVRSFDRRQLIRLEGVEITGAVRELFESAIVMGRQALIAMGISEEEVATIEEEYRRADNDRLCAQIKSGDLFALRHTMLKPGWSHRKDNA